MTLNDVMGLVSTVALSLPILILIATKLAGYRTFPALVVYYSILVIYNILVQRYVHADTALVRYIGIGNNLVDAPLMLTFLSYFSTTPLAKQRTRLLVATFVGFEILIIAFFGFTVQTITIIMGPGLLLVLAFCLPLFVRQIKITITHHKASGRSLMIASLLIAYGCYTIIYIMYYLMDSKNEADTFLVYFLVTTFSSILMAAGIYLERKRVRKLSELKVVRKELSELYSDENTAPPLRTAIFDFDKDQWN